MGFNPLHIRVSFYTQTLTIRKLMSCTKFLTCHALLTLSLYKKPILSLLGCEDVSVELIVEIFCLRFSLCWYSMAIYSRSFVLWYCLRMVAAFDAIFWSLAALTHTVYKTKQAKIESQEKIRRKMICSGATAFGLRLVDAFYASWIPRFVPEFFFYCKLSLLTGFFCIACTISYRLLLADCR